jgi:HEAT repeat protein
MNTKQLLTEWRSYLSENRIYSMHELVQTIKDTRGEDDVKIFIDSWKNNRFLTKYTQVIKRELETTSEPVQEILDVCKLHYEKIYQSSGPRDTSAIGSGSVSIDDLRKAIDAKKNFNKNEVRQQCSYANGRPVVGKYNDFNVFHSGNDWVVIEPKTIQGSIAWAHGKPDGTEETDQSRRVGWCTGVSSENNMFPNYAGNLHMFYFIKSDYENVKGPERRLCVSYINNDGKAKIADDASASVDANNKPINKEYLNSRIDKSILSKLESLVSSRKDTNFAEICSKMTLSQLLRQVEQMKANNISSEEINRELSNYCEFSKDLEVVKYCVSKGIKLPAAKRKDLFEIDPSRELIRQLANDEEEDNIRYFIASNKDLLKLEISHELIRQFASDEAYSVRMAIAQRKDLLEIDFAGELIMKLASDENEDVRRTIAEREDLLKAEPSGKLIMKLASDENEHVRSTIAQREDLLKADPSGELVLKLANDNARYIRLNIAKRKDLLKADPSGKLVLKLANDKDYLIRKYIAELEDLREIDPSGKLIMKFANDKNEDVRGGIASREDLREIDPSGELVLKLANDEAGYVRNTIARRKDLLEIDPSGGLIRKLANDKDEYVRYFIALHKDLLEIDPSGGLIRKLANDKSKLVSSKIKSNVEYKRILNNLTETMIRAYIRYLIS